MASNQYVKVRNIKNGGIYLLRMSKINKEIGEWEQVFDLPVEPKEETSVDKETDLEPSYADLKKMLTALNIEFKGNAPKEELLKLYEETI